MKTRFVVLSLRMCVFLCVWAITAFTGMHVRFLPSGCGWTNKRRMDADRVLDRRTVRAILPVTARRKKKPPCLSPVGGNPAPPARSTDVWNAPPLPAGVRDVSSTSGNT